MKLFVATGNAGKLKEIRSLFAQHQVEVLGLADFNNPPEVLEDGDSFAANAAKKATEMARFSGCLTLADDSGLVVPALDGAPGIFSARYAGHDATDEQNNLKLQREIKKTGLKQPPAYFCCVMALAAPGEECQLFEGRINGVLMDQPRGTQGFGYDPLFLVPEYGKTLAELPLEIKNRISHRGAALRQVVSVLAPGSVNA